MNDVDSKLVGNDPTFLRLLHTMRMVAITDASVIIMGEKGVGKSLLAKQLHLNSRRQDQSFVSISCAGMPDDQFTAELLGTGPLQRSGTPDSRLHATLFFDEVDDLSERAQSVLFHFLDIHAAAADVRILSSASSDLIERVKTGQFREDLFYRLHVVPLELPPLRERPGDLVLLLKHFTREIAADYRRPVPNYSVGARNLLKAYDWPGNLRELRNLCERMAILMAGKTIQPENLPLEIRLGPSGVKSKMVFALPAEGIDLLEMEGDMIRQALGMSGGNRSKAARLLRLTRDTLLYRIQKHKIEI